ncbi:MAG: 16S rRNA (guanine(527)-N(7))-methyltransferase RsmG [Halanaerobiales bacterium]
MIKKEEFDSLLRDGFSEMGIEITETMKEQFWTYMNFLQSENRKYNLTGLDQPEEIIFRHFMDSAAIFSPVPKKNWEYVLDIGSGAGFPGMVYNILHPELPVFFLDARRKRVLFLKMLARRLDLSGSKISIVHGRAEEYAHEKTHRAKYNPVVSRAVAPLNVLCEYCLPFVKMSGLMYAYKSINYKQELAEANNAISVLGGRLVKEHVIKVPGIEKKRVILAIEKVRETPGKYPRSPGKPKKSPL